MAVESWIRDLANGFLTHEANEALRKSASDDRFQAPNQSTIHRDLILRAIDVQSLIAGRDFMFTWTTIHREAIRQILDHRQNQKELLTILREMEEKGLKVISLIDKDADDQEFPLEEIDPFTFLASFNRGVTDKNRRENWSFLKTR